jgi:hypothetical protein
MCLTSRSKRIIKQLLVYTRNRLLNIRWTLREDQYFKILTKLELRTLISLNLLDTLRNVHRIKLTCCSSMQICGSRPEVSK